jgi:capsular exopolysaccharide synthesis family protein
MSKIYEALQYAQKMKKGKDPVARSLIPFAPPEQADTELGEEMLSLYKMIDALLSDGAAKIIQFIGSREGEGTSTVAREYARVCADLIGHSVLLLDADRYQPVQAHYFDVRNEYGWIDALKKGDQTGSAYYRIGQSTLCMSPSCNSSTSTPEIFKSPIFAGLCEALKADFDLVLIDSAPLSVSPDGLAIASKVDGVILVVESEKTRWHAVKQAQESISMVGGKVLGIVLNKRRHYIPQALYKYL